MRLKIGLIITLLLTLPALNPLFRSGYFTMHDDQQVVRLYQLDKAMTDGHFPVRWVSDLGFGYGYPLFVFYPPLIYYLGWIYLTVLPIGYIGAIKLVFTTSFVASAATMFLWLRRNFGTWGAIAGAIFYTYAPYRSVDAYVRGALAEAFSFVFLPLIMLAIELVGHKYMKKDLQLKYGGDTSIILDAQIEASWWQKWQQWVQEVSASYRQILLLAFSYAGLMLTHNLIALPFSLMLPVYYLLTLPKIARDKWFVYTSQLVFAGLIGLGLSSFFWLPALAEKQHTIVDSILLVERYDYSLHFVYPQQLWNSIWGYGGSTEGLLDGMSFKVGKLALVLSMSVFVFGLGLTLAGMIKQTRSLPLVSFWLKHFSQQASRQAVLGSMLVLSLVMSLEVSKPVWQLITPLQFLQFPWRFLTFITLFSAVLVASSVPMVAILWKYLWHLNAFTFVKSVDPLKLFILKQLAPKLDKLVSFYYVLGIIALLFYTNLKLFTPQRFLDVDDAQLTSKDFVSWDISRTSFEFVPKGVETRIDPQLQITQLAIDYDQIPNQSVEVINGSAAIEWLEDLTHKKRLLVSTESMAQLQFNTFSFPGWVLYKDGKKVDYNDDNRLKLITTLVPAGEHELLLVFENTRVRLLSNQISLFTFGLILSYLLIPNIMKRTKGNYKSKI